MLITGDVSNLELDNIRFTNLKGVETRCHESLEEFKEGDEVIIICKGKVTESNIDVITNSIYFVKENHADTFLSRFIDTLPKTNNIIEQEIEKPTGNL